MLSQFIVLLQVNGPLPDMNLTPDSEMPSRALSVSNAEPSHTSQANYAAAVRGKEQEQGWKLVGPRSPRRTTSSAGRRFGRSSSGMTCS